MSRVTVELSQEDRAMLKQLALRDYRTIGQQAAFLISKTLQKEHLEPAEPFKKREAGASK